MRALELHHCRVAAVQVVLLKRSGNSAERLKVRRMQASELASSSKHVDKRRLAALDSLVKAERVEKLETGR